MICDIILSKNDSRYFARIKEWPEVSIEADSRDKAIQGIRMRLTEYLTKKVEIVRVDIPISQKTDNPWLDTFASFKDDPTFDDFLTEIREYRQKADSPGEYPDI